MCLRTFIRFTFSNKDAFHRILKEIENDKLERIRFSIVGELCLITDSSGLDLNREPYEVLKDKTSYIHAAFTGWKQLKKLIKESRDFPVCGEITIEIRNGEIQFHQMLNR